MHFTKLAKLANQPLDAIFTTLPLSDSACNGMVNVAMVTNFTPCRAGGSLAMSKFSPGRYRALVSWVGVVWGGVYNHIKRFPSHFKVTLTVKMVY